MEDETARGWRDPQVVSLFLRIHHDLINRIIELDNPTDYSLRALRGKLISLSPMINAQTTALGCRAPLAAL
jgi:hypothetical protein